MSENAKVEQQVNICENSAAGDDVNRVDQCESSLDFNDMEKGAEKVLNCGENAFKEDCSSNVANETEKVVKSIDEDTTNGISLIPLRKLKLRDDQIRKLITERFESKKLMVRRITIHRDFEDGTMVRSDISVEPLKVALVSKSYFGFESESWVLLSCPTQQHGNGQINLEKK